MALSVDSVSPATVPEDGGYLIEITCTDLVITNQYQVHIGPLGTLADPVCYSGIPDQGSIVYPWTATIVRAYIPIMDPTGGPYDLTLEDVTLTLEDTLAAAVTVLPREFNSRVFGVRQVLPPFYRTGARSLKLVK